MKRGTRKRNILNKKWREELAYAVGLIASDGNVSPDKRHIGLTSKDYELADLFRDALGIHNKIGKKSRAKGSNTQKYFVVQFGSVDFVEFLLSIGLTSAKSKTIERVLIPDVYFFDFLRGCYDGDGNYNEFAHPEARVLQLRTRLYSASPRFLNWIHSELRRFKIVQGGWINKQPVKLVYSLSFGKTDSIALFKVLYTSKTKFYLQRKYAIAKKYLRT